MSSRVDQASFGKCPLNHKPGIRLPSKTDVNFWSTFTYILESIKYLNYVILLVPTALSPDSLTIVFSA